ncbi:2-polyprenyl-3-methyl-5-hydroxy-6-metoxy-1,4-benzoquinol methylase [Bellilinea caldifistulae]|uniref:Methyltransferase domain-containing protein n=1 Tax=Bellilinea caldifistulae TaxID=360411 RepID=A0A0P6XPH1_9CHLR|nr:class I SAM-dependent methyltransferase [Bellilinea caldifistulae]KPL78543.1 hypothetical protein AC812_00915 [Bellilinea caldifistulae]GAP11324.1 2-polyprenyl-3-methyl-5-hydroxy-6-metoxy-1,4-benzoquinol methylase [Bellilinea caldifistulae]GIV64971.1 MAG: hypothetical protein KatS3mg046_231 [Bellilinea sp.]
MEWSFVRYLAAKKSVDDRALNRQVWESLRREIEHKADSQPLRVLEVGMGIGTMFQRMLEWGLVEQAEYIGIDAESENIAVANRIIPSWAKEQGWNVQGLDFQQSAKPRHDGVAYGFLKADLFDFLQQPRWQNYFDLVIANAVLDVVDVQAVLPMINNSLKQGGMGYFSINFDGMTAFEPLIHAALDEQIIRVYHQSMDERRINGKPSGGSRTGRLLFSVSGQAGFDILDAGSSDWVVFARGGQYPADEAYFLHFILHFFEETIPRYPQIDPGDFQEWLRIRHAQIQRGELVFLTHQMDFLVQKR